MNREQRRSNQNKSLSRDEIAKRSFEMANLWGTIREQLAKEGITPEEVAAEFSNWKSTNDNRKKLESELNGPQQDPQR